MTQNVGLNEQMQRVEELVHEIENAADPNLRAKAVELVQTLMDFHSAGLERMMDITARAGTAGYAVFDDFARDEVVSSLLLLYDLHPLEIEDRIAAALEKVRPALNLHEGNVALLGVKDGVVNLRLEGNCHGCPSSLMTLKQTIEEAIYAAAPDVVSIEVEGVKTIEMSNGFVQIDRADKSKFTNCEFTA